MVKKKKKTVLAALTLKFLSFLNIMVNGFAAHIKIVKNTDI